MLEQRGRLMLIDTTILKVYNLKQSQMVIFLIDGTTLRIYLLHFIARHFLHGTST